MGERFRLLSNDPQPQPWTVPQQTENGGQTYNESPHNDNSDDIDGMSLTGESLSETSDDDNH